MKIYKNIFEIDLTEEEHNKLLKICADYRRFIKTQEEGIIDPKDFLPIVHWTVLYYFFAEVRIDKKMADYYYKKVNDFFIE